jgi:DNA polymerase-3 subunit alpha
MEKFAGYGFNKSHAAAYSLLAYHTGWLKVHYTAEFFCANMTVEMDDTDKLKVLFEDAQKNFGITFEPPDVNRGNYRFEPVTDKVIRYGLGAVKGTGQQAVEAIVRGARRGRPFKSLYDFCVRMDRTAHQQAHGRGADQGRRLRQRCSRTARRWWPRSTAPSTSPMRTEANANQGGLFDMGDSHGASTQEPDLVEATPWGVKERLTLEKTAVGFYLSGHLFDEVSHEVRRFCKRKIEDLVDSRDQQLLAGIVSDCASSTASAASWRSSSSTTRPSDRGHGRRGADQRQPQPAQGRRTGHRAAAGCSRRAAASRRLPGAAGVGPGHGALPLRQVPARGRERQGAGHRSGWCATSRRAREQTEQGDLVRGLPVRLSVARAARPTAELQLGERPSSSRPMRRWPAGWRRRTSGQQAQIVYESARPPAHAARGRSETRLPHLFIDRMAARTQRGCELRRHLVRTRMLRTARRA